VFVFCYDLIGYVQQYNKKNDLREKLVLLLFVAVNILAIREISSSFRWNGTYYLSLATLKIAGNNSDLIITLETLRHTNFMI
jgi:hypothetical protein